MIGVRVRVDDVVDAQPVARSKREIPIDLADLRIDERGRARVRAANEVRLATAGSNLFEEHRRPRDSGQNGSGAA
jgi:hypothetical protein